jgi:15-cis-phytoene synthase
MTEQNSPVDRTEGAADAVRAAARVGAPDRYLSALLAPRRVRGDLVALAAFSAEINRIAHQVHEPHLGEIRLQWWRDGLAAGGQGEKSGHPVADAFSEVMRRHDVPIEILDGYFDAQVHNLYADSPADEAHLALGLDLIEGTVFALAAQILGREKMPEKSGIMHHAAQAYGLARLGLELPYALARGRTPLPPSMLNVFAPDWRQATAKLVARARTHLAHVRTAYAAEPRAVQTALLPLALVEPYLKALSRPGHDPEHDVADIAPLTRTWRLAKTHATGRL